MDGNIGSIFDIGAPAWTGGYLQPVNTFGLERSVARCAELSKAHGPRFEVPAIIHQKIKAKELVA